MAKGTKLSEFEKGKITAYIGTRIKNKYQVIFGTLILTAVWSPVSKTRD